MTETSDPDNLPPDTPWWFRMAVRAWRHLWGWATNYGVAALIAIPGIYEGYPPIKEIIPSSWAHYAQIMIGVVTFFKMIHDKVKG